MAHVWTTLIAMARPKRFEMVRILIASDYTIKPFGIRPRFRAELYSFNGESKIMNITFLNVD